MSHTIDELAGQITRLPPSDQEQLWESVAEMHFLRGLKALSQTYRERLAAQGKLHQQAEEVMADLAHIREEIAADEYQR
jgi:hypothetical protein